MKLEFAIFCDAAEVDESGLIYMLRGGFDLVRSSAFPTELYRMMIVVRIICEPTETNQKHIFKSHTVGPDGNILPWKEIEFPFTPSPYPVDPKHTNRQTIKLDYQLARFEKPGFYKFCFFVDDKSIGDSVLDVRRI
jgi:hypothetical protein